MDSTALGDPLWADAASRVSCAYHEKAAAQQVARWTQLSQQQWSMAPLTCPLAACFSLAVSVTGSPALHAPSWQPGALPLLSSASVLQDVTEENAEICLGVKANMGMVPPGTAPRALSEPCLHASFTNARVLPDLASCLMCPA